MTIGNRIKQLREEKRLSKYRICNETGIGYRTLIDIEQDKANPQINTLIRLADIMGITLSHMFKGVDKSV